MPHPSLTIVVFACVHNAGRSQMAAAFFNRMTEPVSARAISAGTRPALHVHPEVVEVMLEVGVDLSSARPQRLTPELVAGATIWSPWAAASRARSSLVWSGMTGTWRTPVDSPLSVSGRSAMRSGGASQSSSKI